MPNESFIYLEITNKLNFACHQCSYPLIIDLRIKNNSLSRLNNVSVTLVSNPSFTKQTWTIDRIDPDEIMSINNRDVELDGDYFLNLTESVRGTVTIIAEHDGKIIGEETKPVELLAYNEWGGSGYMPELLAAFSLPNDPAVSRILRDASIFLRKAGKPSAIDGYQAGSRQRVWEISSAIYTAICSLGISYAVPPASFERDGQKIRLPGQIIEHRLATCLDTTMLFASALEQAGLNPIIALPQGHALVGVWLQPEELATIVIDEAETLRKRIQLKELLLIETTLVTSHPAPPFSQAVSAAIETIIPEKDNTFISAIDIRRARAHRITPLGKKYSQPSKSTKDKDSHIDELTLEEAPALPGFDDGLEEDVVPETPTGRLERWQRKLLDLSARNPLLNHKSTKTSLRFICPEPGLLEDKLAEGSRISIQSVFLPTTQGQSEELHRQRTGEVITVEYARAALERKQVLVDLPEEELARRALEIYRKAQTSLQEGGANTLFLALGFLLWKQDKKDDRRFRAPLILLPVTLERKSIRSGIRMLAHDDEPRINTTLLEMLRKDFQLDIRALAGPLPTDHSGIDVKGIWTTVRKAVKEVPGFEVIEEIALGHFSFAKYLMWKDLVDRTDALRKNSVVRHLIDTPREPYPSEIGFVDGDQIDRHYKPSDLLTPLPADSAQMAAIATADRGKDFIIEGPPGTGKSQTISNLIAHLLGKGKTVLFVSEKTAALQVVYRRLRDIGLGRFCLELHSNKARKSDVLEQLRNALEYRQETIAVTWEKEAERLLVLRDQLNRYVDRLHMPRRNGMTVHHAIGVKIRDKDLAARVTFAWPSADYHDEARIEAMREAVEKLRIQAATIGDLAASPFKLVTKGDWSPQWEGQLLASAERLSVAAASASRACEALLDLFGISVSGLTIMHLDAVTDLAAILLESYGKPTAYALEKDGIDRIDALDQAIQRLKVYSEVEATLSCAYVSMAWRKLDGEEIARHWKEAESTWWPKSFFARRRIIKDMKDAGANGEPNPKQDALVLKRLRIEGKAIDRLGNLLSEFKDWEGLLSDPEILLVLHNLGQRIRVAIGKLANDAEMLAEIRGKVLSLLKESNELLAPDAAIGRAAEEFLRAIKEMQDACGIFETIAGKSVRDHFAKSGNALESIRESMDSIIAHREGLHEWCGWRRRRNEAMDLELDPLVKIIENGGILAGEIPATFEAAYCAWWSGAVISEDEVLCTFSTPEHVDAIERFRELDTRFQKLTAEYIAARLAGNLPDAGNALQKSSWGILRHELQKKTRHKPVRQLLQEIPDVLTTLAPCLMMSPLSIAQYLSAEQDLFDVVIFDEASQITVWDAVGSLARGRQVIVAGDPKQMPPTNYFARADDDPNGEIDAEGDLESILDEMLGASIPQRTLNLHYRSRKESLIAFSNSRYYDNKLITFPAPVTPDYGVRLIRPDGFYARGKSRDNEGEAKAIVAEIVRRLTSEDSIVRQQSIGVVTFNTEQKTLIEDLLEKACFSNPEIEWALREETSIEPVFVKNLETVQGDERDVILFSITYGPDESNLVTMNFGPLNRSGGERRLNVAMTRARSEMLVYSTLSPDQIILSRTQARAVVDLKHFLEYAERGPKALGTVIHGSVGDFESPFESTVARGLRDKGWIVHPQVGVSAFRIDFGVVHPDKPGIYLAGVECDGTMYHSSAFARERDKIRQSVLEGLGWTLFRIWSTDWWNHHEKALETLHKALTLHLEVDREKRRQVDTIPAVSAMTTSSFVAQDNVVHEEINSDALPVKPTRKNKGTSNSTDLNNDIDAKHDEHEITTVDIQICQRSPSPCNLVNNHDKIYYDIAQFEGKSFMAIPDMFYSVEYKSQLSAMIDYVIDTESPVHEDILVKRIAKYHGFNRSGRKIIEIITELAKRRKAHTVEDVGVFFWREDTIDKKFVYPRYKNRDTETRKIEYICKQEIQSIYELLSFDYDPLEFARHLGISRLSQDAKKRLDKIFNKKSRIDSFVKSDNLKIPPQ